MATPAQILTTIRYQAYESSAAFYKDAEIRSYIWQGESILAKAVKCSENTDTSLSSVASQREYTIPTGVIEIQKVTWDSYPLEKIDINELDVVEGAAYGFTGTTGQPINYYEHGTKIGLSPIPTTVKTIKLWYIKEPAEITPESTALTIPSDFGFYLVDYCLYRMYLKDAETERANRHLELWMNNLKTANIEWRQRSKANKITVVMDNNLMPKSSARVLSNP